MHLEVLSEDNLCNVLRKLSAKPRLPNWKKFISPQAIVSFLQMGGRCTHAAQGRFKGLDYDYLLTYPDMFGGHEAVGFLTSQLGPSLRAIHIDAGIFPTSMSTWIIEQCQSLRVLSIARPDFKACLRDLPVLLKNCGSKLEELAVDLNLRKPDVTAIAKHCSSLRRLGFSRVPSVPLDTIWKSRRGLLHDLELSLSDSSIDRVGLNSIGECRE